MALTVLVLGGTGKTARHLSGLLREAGDTVRTAARHGADVRFDWSDAATHGPALDGVDRVYLIPPAFDLGFAGVVSTFLDRAETAGVGHVTYLSAHGVEHLPPEVAMRAVELDLAARNGFTHSVLRPSWFMQNFSEGAFAPFVQSGTLALPAGDGAEAFVDTRDIAAAAAATLRNPAAHSGAAYAVTGPEALTFAEVAATLSTALGRQVRYQPIATAAYVENLTTAGVPADYAALLGGLLEVIAAGQGARPQPEPLVALRVRPHSFAQFAADAWASTPA